MQIVIDIPNSTFTDLKKKQNRTEVDVAVLNGTPIPKGHGRIADMDEAIKCIKDCEGDDAIWAISLIDWACGKRTLLEADRAESEGEK